MELSICGLCQLQVPTNNTQSAELPLYNPQMDSLNLSSKKICKSCHLLVIQINQFSTHYQIKYCDTRFKSVALDSVKAVVPQARQSLQLLYASSNANQRSRANSQIKGKILPRRFSQSQTTINQNQQEEPIHPYFNLVVEQLRNKNILCFSYLPKTLQLLIYLSTQQATKSAFISPQERREKIKNTILFLTESIYLNVEQLPYVTVLINFLFCLMDPTKATAIVMRLSDIIISYPHLLTWKTLILEQEVPESKNPHSPPSMDLRTIIMKVQKLWLRIQSILELSKKGESVLHEGLIRMGKLNIFQYKQYRKRLSEVLKPLFTKKQERQQMKEERLKLLYLTKLEKNSFSLVLRHMLECQQELKQEMIMLNTRHKKQKDEYIQTIVKLSNKIEELQSKMSVLKKEQKQPVVTEFDSALEFPSNKEVNIKIQPITHQTHETQELSVTLQSILTLSNLVAFNQEHLGSINKQPALVFQQSDALTRIIIAEIQKLQQAYQKLFLKSKSFEKEISRLLEIKERQDNRLISVITEKDIIIQQYQQALWSMENGIQVTQEPLAHRIRYIMHIFPKKMLQRQCEQEQKKETKEGRQGKECDIY